jgi:short-subunit dehydrogenase
MSLELDADNINVSVVCPSFFRTNLAESVRASDADSQAATQRLVNKAKLGADEIAGRVFSAIEKGEFYILPHPEGRTIWRLKRWLPFKRYRAMMLKQTARMMTNKRKG